jgi:hypothetical protein
MFPSVTRIRCTCGFLKRDARDLSLPLRFDPILNEYSFQFDLPSGTRMTLILSHCPRCGGVASASDRDKFFALVSAAESSRLKAITDKLTNVQKIERTLGASDEDRAYMPIPEFAEMQPRSGRREMKKIRVMYYTRLSETADVHFKVYSNGEVERLILPKYLGHKRQPPRSARKRRSGRPGSRSARAHPMRPQ